MQRGLEVVEFSCGIPTLLMGETLEHVSRGVDCHTIRQPLGVAVGITPFNFPAMVPLWMLPLAIACGNTFVLKPSEKVPLTATRLVELLAETGLPAGVVSLVHGTAPQVEQLVDHALVKAVSIVGSSAAAASVYARAAARGKRVQALGGAKNHMVVMPDADLDQAVPAIVGSAFGSAGERCMAGSVVVAVEPGGDALVARIKARAAELKMSAGDEAGAELGPLVTAAHRDRVAQYLDGGRRGRRGLVLDGRARARTAGLLPRGQHLRPREARHADRARGDLRAGADGHPGGSLAEALAVVNQSALGNAASIFTRDGGAARTFTSEVEAGMIGVNVGVPVPMAMFPFAGWKGSFFGDLHAHGKDGVRFYTEQKVVTTRITTRGTEDMAGGDHDEEPPTTG